MTAVTLEREADKLQNHKGRVEVRDPDGVLLGYFVPERIWPMYDIAIPYSEEELRRSEQQAGDGNTYTTAEVLAHLQSLGPR